MGHNVSVVNGVRSENFYEQRNGIHEIWVDGTELISRLPFGDSDLGQSSWQAKWPKVPWHQFIIPLKRDVSPSTTTEWDAKTLLDVCGRLASPAVPDTSYWHMYDHMSPTSAYWLGLILVFMSYAMMFYSTRLLWDWVKECNSLKRRFPEHSSVCHLDIIPHRITSWAQITPWLTSYLIRSVVLSSLAILFSVIGVPALISSMRFLHPGDLVMTWGLVMLTYYVIQMVMFNLMIMCFLNSGIQKNQRAQERASGEQARGNFAFIGWLVGTPP